MADTTTNTASKVAVSDLEPDHLQAFTKALRRVMKADHTRYALAQIVDGLPTRDVYKVYGPRWRALNDHLEPSSEAIEMAREFVTNFRPDALYIESNLAQAFQDTSIGTRQFNLRLLEMVAVAFHMTAAVLFDNTNSAPYKRPMDVWLGGQPISETTPMPPRFPTLLFHVHYKGYDQYPLGIPDTVGYWTEAQVFGGVVLFDRGESEIECREAFLHPNANYAIFQLSEGQIAQFADFALNDAYDDTNPPSDVLPIRGERYARRVYPEDAMQLHIFRDRYERRPWQPLPGRTVHPRRRLEDDPWLIDLIAEHNRNHPLPSSEGSSAPEQNGSESSLDSKP